MASPSPPTHPTYTFEEISRRQEKHEENFGRLIVILESVLSFRDESAIGKSMYALATESERKPVRISKPAPTRIKRVKKVTAPDPIPVEEEVWKKATGKRARKRKTK